MSSWKHALEKLPTNSVLVSTANQGIVRFYCPIAAVCHRAIAGYVAGEQVFIEGIDHDEHHALVYLIGGIRLPHHYFYIQSKPKNRTNP